ncbi:hypothetical protein [Hydrogenophaga aquatica]
MTTKSQAIKQLAAIKTERDRLSAEAQVINAKADTLRDQLADLEAAATGDAEAVVAATAALATALEAGDREAIESARNRAAAASKAAAMANGRETEITALRVALAGLQEKARPLGQRMMELAEHEKGLTGQRLDEVAAEVAQRYQAKMCELALIVAEAQALAVTAIRIDRPGNYAPPPYAVPSLVGESICASGRVAIDLAPMRDKAISKLVGGLQAEGFEVGM